MFWLLAWWIQEAEIGDEQKSDRFVQVLGIDDADVAVRSKVLVEQGLAQRCCPDGEMRPDPPPAAGGFEHMLDLVL